LYVGFDRMETSAFKLSYDDEREYNA